MALFGSLCALALAYSGGGGPSGEGQSCDAVNICASGTCPKGMTRVAPPERSSAFTIRTADGADDPTSYIPAETVTIHIKVTEQLLQNRKSKGKYTCVCDWPYTDQERTDCTTPYMPKTSSVRRKRAPDGTYKYYPGPIPCTTKKMESATYIGLLIYAVNAAEKKVGTWEIPTTEPTRFFTPPDPLCGGVAVMHADATPKRLMEKIVFRAPPVGYGTITFRALLKHGDTNGGSFFWPTAPASGATSGDTPSDGVPGGDLTLNEAALPVGGQTWFRATAAGQSCTDVCQALTPAQVCDLDALTNVGDDPASLQLATKRFYSLNSPAVSDCNNARPALSDTDERWLFFHKTSSTSNTCDVSQLKPVSCDAAPTEDGFKLRRLCPCKSSRRRLTFRPPHTFRRQSTAARGAPSSARTPRRRLRAAVYSAALMPQRRAASPPSLLRSPSARSRFSEAEGVSRRPFFRLHSSPRRSFRAPQRITGCGARRRVHRRRRQRSRAARSAPTFPTFTLIQARSSRSSGPRGMVSHRTLERTTSLLSRRKMRRCSCSSAKPCSRTTSTARSIRSTGRRKRTGRSVTCRGTPRKRAAVEVLLITSSTRTRAKS